MTPARRIRTFHRSRMTFPYCRVLSPTTRPIGHRSVYPSNFSRICFIEVDGHPSPGRISITGEERGRTGVRRARFSWRFPLVSVEKCPMMSTHRTEAAISESKTKQTKRTSPTRNTDPSQRNPPWIRILFWSTWSGICKRRNWISSTKMQRRFVRRKWSVTIWLRRFWRRWESIIVSLNRTLSLTLIFSSEQHFEQKNK